MEAEAGLVAGARLEPGLLVLQGPPAKEDIMEGVEQTLGALIPGAGVAELQEQENRSQIYPGSASPPASPETLRSTTAEVEEVSSSMENLQEVPEGYSPLVTGRVVVGDFGTEALLIVLQLNILHNSLKWKYKNLETIGKKYSSSVNSY